MATRLSTFLLRVTLLSVCYLKLNLNKWRGPTEVTAWFRNIRCKWSASYLKFNVISFYQSIKKELLIRALTFAQTHIFINNRDIEKILATRQSFLYNKDNPWVKIGSGDFDIPHIYLGSGAKLSLKIMFPWKVTLIPSHLTLFQKIFQ